MINKSKSAFRTIAEVASEIGVATHVLRFWETKFPQISPMKASGGRRYYRPDDVELIKLIRDFLYEKRYTIEGVQKVFKEHGTKAFLKGEIQKDFFDIPSTEDSSALKVVEEKIVKGTEVSPEQIKALEEAKQNLLELKDDLKNFLID